MALRFTAIIVIFSLVLGCPVWAQGKAIHETLETVLSADAWDDVADGVVLGSPIIDGQWVSYNISVTKGGYYKFLFYGKVNAAATLSLYANEMQMVQKKLAVTANNERRTFGRYYFSAGTHILKMLVETGSVTLGSIVVKSVEHAVTAQGEVFIAANDYYTTNLTTLYQEDAQWNYTSSNTGYTVKGPIVGSEQSKMRSLSYRLNVERAGVHRLKVFVARTVSSADFVLESDGHTLAQAFMPEPEQHSSATICEEAVFNTFNLPEGEQIIQIKGRSNEKGSNMFIYYFLLERVEDLKPTLQISTSEESIIEARDYVYPSGGIAYTDNTITVQSQNTALLYGDFTQAGIYAISIVYKADTEAVVALEIGNSRVFTGTLVPTTEQYREYTLSLGEITAGLKRIAFSVAQGELEIDKIIIHNVTESQCEQMTASVNSASGEKQLISVLSEYGTATGIAFDDMLSSCFYKAPVYKRLLHSNYSDASELLKGFQTAVENERDTVILTDLNSGERIFELENGNIEIALKKPSIKNMPLVILAAIYENEEKLYNIKMADNDEQDVQSFVFQNLQINQDKFYDFRLLCWEDLETIKPYDIFPKVYRNIYIAPNGNDLLGSGSQSNPFVSVSRAMVQVAEINDRQWGDIVVNILPGEYKLTQTEQFNPSHSGKNGFRVIIRGEGDDAPVISGGVKVIGWEAHSDGIWKAPLAGMEYVRNLYVDGYPAIRARSEDCYTPISEHNEPDSEWARDGILVSSDGLPLLLDKTDDLELVWNRAFMHFRTPVEEIKTYADSTAFLLKRPVLNYNADNFRAGQSFYLENAFELLDTPGEFYYDKADGFIYYYPYPQEDMTTAQAYVGDTELLIKVSGDSADNKVKNIVFENLKICNGAYNFASRHGYIGSQADGFNAPFTSDDGKIGFAAQFAIDMADNIAIKNCEIFNLGSAAISMLNGVSNAVIEGNIIRDISGTAICIGTPLHHTNVKGQEVCRNIDIKNNVIRRIASEFFNNTAISIYYERDINVIHNDIMRTPYTGITAGWGWDGSDPYDCGNINISYNKIQDVMETLYDGGGIYTLGKLNGSIISNNYLNGHHAQIATGMIYLDSGSAHLKVFDNVILNAIYYLHFQSGDRFGNHDLHFFNNFANIDNMLGKQELHNSIIVEPVTLMEEDMPPSAVEIAANAGITDKYADLFAKDNFPDWRDVRFNVPTKVISKLISIPAEFYDAAGSMGAVLQDAMPGYALTISDGQYAAFNVQVPQAGWYKLLIHGRYPSTPRPSITVEGVGDAKPGIGITYLHDNDSGRNTIGRYYLEEGENQIILNVNGGTAIIKEVLLKCVEHDIKPQRETVIEAHDYYISNISGRDQEDTQYNYTAHGVPYAIKGPIIAHPNPVRTALYKVKVEESGTYRVKLYAANSGSATVTYTIKDEGGEILAQATKGLPAVASSTICEEAVFNDFTLSEGEQELIITASDLSVGSYVAIYYYVFEKIG
jgi:hypothetical protein